MHPLALLDHNHIWHPFTQMKDWLKHEPIVLVKGRRSTVTDAHGKTYIDANSSIWTNLHGHNHPAINRAIRQQLRRVAHTSALGLANEPASLLAEQLIQRVGQKGSPDSVRSNRLQKVFFSDDGSTAMEVALKLAYEFTRRTQGPKSRPRFLSLKGAYHGDTVGAVSLGHIDLFHRAYRGLLFRTESVMSPYCYRCPYNRASPQRADARDYRQCHLECVQKVERVLKISKQQNRPISAFVFEPGIQGSAGMVPQPKGWLLQVTDMARHHGALLIADEVLTGLGRSGLRDTGESPILGSQREDVQPDMAALAKGLTGGYLPLAATLTSKAIFDSFLGEYSEFKTFFHGHSYTANQLGARSALASLELLDTEHGPNHRRTLEEHLRNALKPLWEQPHVGDIRQVGLIVGIELVKDWTRRNPYALEEQAGIRVTQAMAKRGVLTRPIGNVVVLMPPYCTTPRQVGRIVTALQEAMEEVL
jgi:adenosylmethionine---8-amino-7-oxononanoate aminotransferase